MGYPPVKNEPDKSSGIVVALLALGLGGLLFVGLIVVMGLAYVRTGPTAATPEPVQEVVLAAPNENITTPRLMSAEELYRDRFIVDIDRNGQATFDGQTVTPQQLEERLRQAMFTAVAMGVPTAEIRFDEACPYEHLQAIETVFKNLNIENPTLTAVPPERQVLLELDAVGRVSIDGEQVPDVQKALQEIAKRHGVRATATLRVNPECPAAKVVEVRDLRRKSAIAVTIETAAGDQP